MSGTGTPGDPFAMYVPPFVEELGLAERANSPRINRVPAR
jgi:hypothetical protein